MKAAREAERAMEHRLRAEGSALHGAWSSAARPVLTVEPGDAVCYEGIPDVSWGLEPPTSVEAPRRKVEPREPGPCLCGPVAVRGAEAGDVIEVVIEALRPSAWGWTYAGAGMATAKFNTAVGVGGEPLSLTRWRLSDDRAKARSDGGWSVEVRPFFGTIGLAPALERADGWTARACGGNMDCRELVAGSRLFLPVHVSGGLLSVGDGHAAQGDGEVAGTAIECMMDSARLRLLLHKGVRLAWPRALTPAGWVTIGCGPTLDEAARIATAGMADLVEELTGLGRAAAISLASVRASLRVTQVVNPAVGVHAVMPVDALMR
ncbi:MAG: acetamidase/formamidase family protein [Phycisphaerae bacterium]|nr:acetamidase/formamidase family protein [Phycisphaerae bacterium]